MSSPKVVEYTSPKLDTLPSELRRLIVSHLAPSTKIYAKGCKKHLKNANLAHSCLREWVPEFLFRDMVLPHVLVGMSFQLQRFAVDPAAAKLLKHVKTIGVKVPPAIRWEINSSDPFNYIDDITSQRLKRKFNISDPALFTKEQRQYCSDYHQAMVEPFTDSRRWLQLLSYARHLFPRIFGYFLNLETISVGICGRTEHPASTYTNLFVTQYGEGVINDVHPLYVEDPNANLAWASAVVLQSAPPSVKALHLSMANLDNLNSFATVNRLLSICYKNAKTLNRRPTKAITSLTLDLRGIEGVHGHRDWNGDTGTAGMVRYWKHALGSLPSLATLDLRADNLDHDLNFSGLDDTDNKGCILEWLFAGLPLSNLKTLSVRYFLLHEETIPKIYDGWPILKTLHLEEVRLMSIEEPEGESRPEHLRIIQGFAWLELCRWLEGTRPTIDIELNRPVSNINNFKDWVLHKNVIEKLSSLPNVKMLKTSGDYKACVSLPRDKLEDSTRRGEGVS
ncbi:uncharacterized protein BDR25DRAFT_345296 [Lindgomyces ingoldianus]|uniref:Uncharacterized protein n=1 Tax=Lindgomyces ingoldianus TaxID=673940 RepID=A0ACB6QKL7_9PLEO|nr:uncharacterized protein BDR25DRAFT_345296 [Lindgomyces ingoldianus]KAF2466686.1 hypothetical protein BDR25DRAFT_345296 [Lindgomyces ingoldianus]